MPHILGQTLVKAHAIISIPLYLVRSKGNHSMVKMLNMMGFNPPIQNLTTTAPPCQTQQIRGVS